MPAAENQETEQNQILLAAPELQIAVERRPRLNRDQRLVAGEPVDDVDAEIEVAAEPERRVGEKAAAADHNHALRAVVDTALERDRDVDRPRYVACFIERNLGVELVHFDPPARRDFDQPRGAPLAVLVDTDLARVRKNGIQLEVAEDRMARIIGRAREYRRPVARLQRRVDDRARSEHETEQLGDRLQPAQGLGIDQPQQIAASLQVLRDLPHLGALQLGLRVRDQQQAGVGRHFLGGGEIDAVGLEAFGGELPAEFAEVVIGDAVQAPLTVALERHHQALARAREPHERVDERLLVVVGQVLAPLVVLEHGLAVGADARRLRELGFLARIDERDGEVGLEALVRRQKSRISLRASPRTSWRVANAVTLIGPVSFASTSRAGCDRVLRAFCVRSYSARYSCARNASKATSAISSTTKTPFCTSSCDRSFDVTCMR